MESRIDTFKLYYHAELYLFFFFEKHIKKQSAGTVSKYSTDAQLDFHHTFGTYANSYTEKKILPWCKRTSRTC